MPEDARVKAGWHCADAIRAVWAREEDLEEGLARSPPDSRGIFRFVKDEVGRIEQAVMFAGRACNLSEDELREEFAPKFAEARDQVADRSGADKVPTFLNRAVLSRFRDILHDQITVVELKES